MATVNMITFSFLLTTALSAPVKVEEDAMTLFHGEDFHITMPSLMSEVTFRNRSSPRSGDVFLMRGGNVVNSRAKLNRNLSHLIIDSVGEGDEGVYTMKNPENPEDIRRITLIVRDCSNEQLIKYGDNYHIPVLGVTPPITLEYRPSAVEANQTYRPALVLLTSTGLSRDGYQGRISTNERQVTLSAVTGADEGSYTVRNAEGDIQRKVCLNVKEHQNFVTLPHGKRLKINLILNSSLVHLYYSPDNDPTPRLLLDKGEFTSARTELGLEDRLSMEGSWVFLDQVKGSDVGEFKITDILGFTVSSIHLGIQPYKLESLYVAIIALLGLLVFLLLVCLLSCLIKVKKRAKRAAALEKIGQKSDDEGEAFRQVVKNITKLSEESKHSQADNTEKSQSTEVDIKGLEVSSKEVGVGNLDTSDSGVGFNTALPLDTDTDAPDQNLDSVAVSISVASETKPSPPSTAVAESKPSAPPAMEINSIPVAETKASPATETKKTPDQPVEAKLDVPEPADVKLSPALSPEPKAGLSPDPKPAPSPSPEPKSPASKATTPTPESKSALTPAPDPPKPTTPEPITNGTPEQGPEAKPSPDHPDIIGAPKAAPPKTPEVELKSSGAAGEASKDGTVAEDSTTTT
ncbi:cadherin-related family member 5 [Etheostoma cragini]|uniref:cadherin-related family member 5 n=1 Tax=Etheostoma cragini TaxID=417921 RepID=UPI00155E785C|nr:cadherin-related family member 5 [Etheostoma cragini]XP_034730076.1 cadherin-related family member 5 [Etheostoma cragini]